MKIRLLCVSTAKNTSIILKRLAEKNKDDIEFVLHVGDVDSDLKASSMTRMTQTTAHGKRHVMQGQQFYGLLHHLVSNVDTKADIATFVDHLHRRDKSYCYKSHNIASMQDYFDYYYILFDVMSKKILENNITHMLFFNVPHLAYDTIFYHLGKALDLKIVIVSQSLFPNKYYSMSNVDDYGIMDVNSDTVVPVKIEKNKNTELFYMKNIKQGQVDSGRVTLKAVMNILAYLIIKKPSYCVNPFKLISLVKRTASIYRKLPKWRDPFARFFHMNEFEYFEHIIQYEENAIDLKLPYVYFPLQLQPEMTTSALGGMFRDQALALECLANMLPENVKIYVKENPKQGAYMRGPLFFHRLKRISSVHLLPSYANTHELTENSLFVCTITGTVGWEAVCKGKKALVFGSTWYQSFPGVFKYREDMTFDEIVDSVIDHASLERSLGALHSHLHEGVVDRHYEQLVAGFDRDRNCEIVADKLLDLLKGHAKFTYGPRDETMGCEKEA